MLLDAGAGRTRRQHRQQQGRRKLVKTCALDVFSARAPPPAHLGGRLVRRGLEGGPRVVLPLQLRCAARRTATTHTPTCTQAALVASCPRAPASTQACVKRRRQPRPDARTGGGEQLLQRGGLLLLGDAVLLRVGPRGRRRGGAARRAGARAQRQAGPRVGAWQRGRRGAALPALRRNQGRSRW